MKCNKCNHNVPDDSEFCPFCCNPIKKNNYCPYCGKELPGDSSFCPFCGKELQFLSGVMKPTAAEPNIKENSDTRDKRTKKRRWLLAAILVVIVFVAIAGGYYVLNTQRANEYLAAKEYSKAVECFDRVLIAESTYSGEYKLAKLGQRFERDEINTISLYAELKKLKQDYEGLVPKSEIDECISAIYIQAVKWYSAKNYGSSTSDKDTAYQYFSAIDPYQDSSKYLTLLRIRANPNSPSAKNNCDDICNIIDFQDSKDVLMEIQSVAIIFLEGKWLSADGEYFFNLEKQSEDYVYYSYSIPFFEMNNSLIGIKDGHLFLYSQDIESSSEAYNQGKYRLLFDITVVNRQQISIYSYKSERSYTLYRQ